MMIVRAVTVLAFALSYVATMVAPSDAQPVSNSDLLMVVVVGRHGIRSPTDPNELAPYVAYPMASWAVPPGNLTPRGATMIENLGASYRSYYAMTGILPITGCPKADSIYVWADVDERTEATGTAFLAGLAPRCGFIANDLGRPVDPLFHALPSVGTADAATSAAAVAAYAGVDPQALVRAYGLAFARLDGILGCERGSCQRISTVPTAIKMSSKSGLASVSGAIDLASTAVEDFILAYADGKPLADIGKGAIDEATLLELSQLHTLKFLVNTEPQYIARTQGSNLVAHVVATIDQGASHKANERTRVPLGARFVAFVGHDTNLEEIAGMLQLRWLVPGYQPSDTPPGGALVFEVHQPRSGATPFVRTFFEAQSLGQMRSLSKEAPARVAVFVPGCPGFDCPLPAFDLITQAAIDPAFVAPW